MLEKPGTKVPKLLIPESRPDKKALRAPSDEPGKPVFAMPDMNPL